MRTGSTRSRGLNTVTRKRQLPAKMGAKRKGVKEKGREGDDLRAPFFWPMADAYIVSVAPRKNSVPTGLTG